MFLSPIKAALFLSFKLDFEFCLTCICCPPCVFTVARLSECMSYFPLLLNIAWVYVHGQIPEHTR